MQTPVAPATALPSLCCAFLEATRAAIAATRVLDPCQAASIGDLPQLVVHDLAAK